MNILRNPWLVGLLAIVAVASVAYQTFHSRPPHAPSPVGASPPPVAPVTQAAASLAPPADPQPAPAAASAIVRSYAESHMAAWLNAPRRDPFLLAKIHPATAPMRPLKLKAIWRQTGGSLAAINHGIYRVGDVVEGCKVAVIDDNEVWLESNGQKILLGFDRVEPVDAPKTAVPNPD